RSHLRRVRSRVFRILSGHRRYRRNHFREAPARKTGESCRMSALAMSIETPDQKVERLNADPRGKSAQEIIPAALNGRGRRRTYVSSFGAESAAMLGLIF